MTPVTRSSRAEVPSPSAGLRRAAVALLVAVLTVAGTAAAREPAVGPASVFSPDLDGPEGLAFTRDGRLLVGSTTGELRAFAPDGTSTLFATVPAPLAGITVLSDGRVLAASVPLDQVWAVSPDGEPSLFVEDIGGPNFIVESARDGRIYASASNGDEIVEITGGIPQVRATGLDFPNGLAIREDGGRRHLYVALTLAGQIVRLAIHADGTLGEPELYAEGLPLVDGIAFDRPGNLLAVGLGVLRVVKTNGEVELLSEDPLYDWPANLAFGQGPGFSTRDIYFANFGPAFGDGTDVVVQRYSNPGAPLASAARGGGVCGQRSLRQSNSKQGGPIRCDAGLRRRLARR